MAKVRAKDGAKRTPIYEYLSLPSPSLIALTRSFSLDVSLLGGLSICVSVTGEEVSLDTAVTGALTFKGWVTKAAAQSLAALSGTNLESLQVR